MNKIIAEAHHDGRKTKGEVGVEARASDEIVVAVSSEQGYAPGARGYSSGGVVALSVAETRELAAALLAAADEAEALPADHDHVKEALKKLGVL